MNALRKLLFVFPVVICCLACKKPFNPTIVATDVGYLVVEGIINSGNDTTFIKLSRTLKLESTKQKPETGARIVIESDKNDAYPLKDFKAGTYFIPKLSLSTDRKYRLHIYTNAGKEYLSDFVENKITPPVDSISYSPTDSGVQFYVSAHDNANKTKYYRWDYDETWSYFSTYDSWYIYDKDKVILRPVDSVLSTCYKRAAPSNSVFVSNSTKLQNDVIANYPIGFVSALTGKLAHVYSINIRQYALTSEAFTYWELIKKNTEQLGSVFDASPSASISNIHSVTDPKEPVIGFVSVSTVTEKRIFVSGRDLPFYTSGLGPDQPPANECPLKSVLFEPLNTLDDRLRRIFSKGDTLFGIGIFNNATKKQIGYAYAAKVCVDCRLSGGTINKPPYWP